MDSGKLVGSGGLRQKRGQNDEGKVPAHVELGQCDKVDPEAASLPRNEDIDGNEQELARMMVGALQRRIKLPV